MHFNYFLDVLFFNCFNMKKISLLLLFACCSLIMSYAQNAASTVSGKWTAEMPGMDGGSMVINYTFKVDGSNLTGTTGPAGMDMESPISEGKIDGKNISFVVAISFGDMDMKMTYKGTFDANEMKLTMDFGMGEPRPITLKKAK